jgi:hypothetical protein
MMILKSIGLLDEIRQSWKDIFHIWRVHFKFTHRPGMQHNNADALSRRDSKPCKVCLCHKERNTDEKSTLEQVRVCNYPQ